MKSLLGLSGNLCDFMSLEGCRNFSRGDDSNIALVRRNYLWARQNG